MTKTEVSAINMALLYRVQIHSFWKYGACVSLKVVTKVFLEVKKLLNLRFLDYFF